MIKLFTTLDEFDKEFSDERKVKELGVKLTTAVYDHIKIMKETTIDMNYTFGSILIVSKDEDLDISRELKFTYPGYKPLTVCNLSINNLVENAEYTIEGNLYNGYVTIVSDDGSGIFLLKEI